MMILRRLRLLAEATQQSVVSVVSQSVLSNLPPATDTVPVELQAEFLRMQMLLGVEELREIAQARVEPGQHERHVVLLRKNEGWALSGRSGRSWRGWRRLTQLMLRKAYAWSLLYWRGQMVPSLEELRL